MTPERRDLYKAANFKRQPKGPEPLLSEDGDIYMSKRVKTDDSGVTLAEDEEEFANTCQTNEADESSRPAVRDPQSCP